MKNIMYETCKCLDMIIEYLIGASILIVGGYLLFYLFSIICKFIGF